MTLLDRIKNLCKAKNISLRKLEQEIELPAATISKWDKIKPSYDKVALIAAYFDKSIDYLILGKETDLTEDEMMLICNYRKAPESFQRAAQALLQQPEQKSSESKIG